MSVGFKALSSVDSMLVSFCPSNLCADEAIFVTEDVFELLQFDMMDGD